MKQNNLIEIPKVVISVIANHVGESKDSILVRKNADIEYEGETIWVTKLTEDTRSHLREFTENDKVQVILIASRSKQQAGGKEPEVVNEATMFSKDEGKTWENVPEGLSPVSGKWEKNGTWALYLSAVEEVDDKAIDLSEYVDSNGKVIHFNPFCSTKFATRSSTSENPNLRKVVGVLTLKYPFYVKVK